ncbi:hypothetical protein PoB_006749100 [Plakobranchus ocellatus]|uniref:C2H2-type domain-containing protein n=1 Tax=Plakobranchus ocellatus TaxID=259542 RepID=A0AAV4DA96_9GAST|nr:hypothetical protein PoB_006749100 [Plakobranchus ocellatus]
MDTYPNDWKHVCTDRFAYVKGTEDAGYGSRVQHPDQTIEQLYNSRAEFPLLSFDYFCSSLVKKGCIGQRVCRGPKRCGKYFPSVAALKRHRALHGMQEEMEVEEEEEE